MGNDIIKVDGFVEGSRGGSKSHWGIASKSGTYAHTRRKHTARVITSKDLLASKYLKYYPDGGINITAFCA